MRKTKNIQIMLFTCMVLLGNNLYSQTETKLISADCDTNHQFGYDVAISGNTIITSAPGYSKTYIYENNAGWTETFNYKRDSSVCSPCLALTTNSKVVDVSKDFAMTGGAGVDHFGPLDQYVATSHEAVMFRKVAGFWQEYFTSYISTACAVTSVAVQDSLSLYGRCNRVWQDDYNALSGSGSEDYGKSMAASDSIVVVGGNNLAMIRISQSFASIPTPANAHSFGSAVAIENDSIFVVSDPYVNDVYVYNKPYWNQIKTIFSLNNGINGYPGIGDRFGEDVAISGDIIAVGAPGVNNNTGAVYLYSLAHDILDEIIHPYPFRIITASDAWEGMNFGARLDLEGDTLVVGVPTDSTNGTASGAVYIYNCLINKKYTSSQPDFGASSGSIDLTVYGGTAPFQYTWSSSQTSQDISGLAAGVYSVTVTDQNSCTSTQEITLPYKPRLHSAEYFFDTDPGMGNGIPLGENSLNYNLDTTYSVSVTWINNGFHQLYIRHMDEYGKWGISEGRTIYIIPDVFTSSSGPIDAMEYFFDTDPGVGNGTSLPVITGDSVNDVFSVTTSGLASGFHTIFLRTRTDNMVWGISEGRTVYVIPDYLLTNPGQIMQMEYFVDTDPGIGNGNNVAVGSGYDINENIILNTTGINLGQHYLYLRVMDSDGVWSIAERDTFEITNCISSNTLYENSCGDYSSPSGNYLWTSSGTYLDTIPNTSSCDSLLTINLTISPSYSITESAQICSGSSYTFPDNTIQTNITGQVIYASTLYTLAGCDSIVETTVDVTPAYNLTENAGVCPGGVYMFPDSTVQTDITGQIIYTSNLLTVSGCDSIIETTLDVDIVDVGVTENGVTLTANTAAAIYTWIDCDNGNATVPGETNQSFTPLTTGNYAVVVNNGTCSDTSTCYYVIITDIHESACNELQVYPNPTSGKITIEGNNIRLIEITNVEGQTIISKDKPDSNKVSIDLREQAKGIYLVKIINNEGVTLKKVVLD